MTASPGHDRAAARHAFTLIELLVAITLIAVIAVLVTPRFRDDHRLRLIAASNVVISDIEYAQTMCISHPDDPVVVTFDPGAASYWLAYAYDPATPLTREDTGEPYLVEFGQGRAASVVDVALAVSGLTDDILAFDSLGALADLGASPVITVTRGNEWLQLTISSTGTIVETSGTGTPP
jgi:prepilin-type N-terminal cleavage/methylation domain-containing protein